MRLQCSGWLDHETSVMVVGASMSNQQLCVSVGFVGCLRALQLSCCGARHLFSVPAARADSGVNQMKAKRQLLPVRG
jgi:hypothetical protein